MKDLRPAFRHYSWMAMPHSKNVPVGCDWVDGLPDGIPDAYRRSGSLTLDETAILWECCCRSPGRWVDVGGATGWTAAHMAAAGCAVETIDPMYGDPAFAARAEDNLARAGQRARVTLRPSTSEEFFAGLGADEQFSGGLVDGCHAAPHPERDAVMLASHLAPTGVILLHDGSKDAVKDAARMLQRLGFGVRQYPTTQDLLVAWRGDFDPPPS